MYPFSALSNRSLSPLSSTGPMNYPRMLSFQSVYTSAITSMNTHHHHHHHHHHTTTTNSMALYVCSEIRFKIASSTEVKRRRWRFKPTENYIAVSGLRSLNYLGIGRFWLNRSQTQRVRISGWCFKNYEKLMSERSLWVTLNSGIQVRPLVWS